MKKKPKAAVEEEPKQERLIVKTRAEAAAALKERIHKGSVRTLNDWFKQGCPNTPGAYDVDAIESWVLENIGSESALEAVGEIQGDRAYWYVFKLREQALKAETERLLLQGKVVETDEVNRLVERLAGTLLSMLGQWPDWILSLMPSEVKPVAKRKIREQIGTKVDDLGKTVSDMLAEWAGEKGERGGEGESKERGSQEA